MHVKADTIEEIASDAAAIGRSSRNGTTLLRAILIAFTIVAVTVNFVNRVQTPLAQDEVTSLIHLKNETMFGVLRTFADGYDTHPPLYFMLLKAVDSLVGGEEYCFQLFSLVMVLAGAFLNYLTLDRCGMRREASLFLAALLLSNFMSQYAISAIRPYPLMYLFLSAALYVRNARGDSSTALLHAVYAICLLGLLYTHYFGAPYVLAFFAADGILAWRARSFRLLLPCTIAILGFLPWIPSLFRQYAMFGQLTWHPAFVPLDFARSYFGFYRYALVIVFPFSVAGIVLWLQGRLDAPARKLLLYSGFIWIIHPVLSPLAWLTDFPLDDRYIFPSILSILFPMAVGLRNFRVADSRWMMAALVLAFAALGAHRAYQHALHATRYSDREDRIIELSGRHPVAVESVRYFFPLYHRAGMTETAAIYLVQDSSAAAAAPFPRHAFFDIRWAALLRDRYGLQKLQTWEEFSSFNSAFYLVTDPERTLLETRLRAPGYTVRQIDDGLYFVRRMDPSLRSGWAP